MLVFIKNLGILTCVIFYIVFFVLSIVAAIKESYTLDKLTLLLVSCLIVCFWGFRPGETTDLTMYLNYFRSFVPDFDYFPWGSYGFFILYSVIKSISDSAIFFTFCTSLFFVCILLIFVNVALKAYPYKSLLLLCIFSSFYILDLSTNTYRQGVAVVFIGLSVCFFYQRSYKYLIICSILAISFHWGALVPICIFVIAIGLSKNIFLLKSMSIITLFLFSISIFIDLNLLVFILDNPILASAEDYFIGVNIASKVEAYLERSIDGALYYELPILSALKFIFEAYIPLIVGVFFIFQQKKVDATKIKNSFYALVLAYFVLLNFYALILISMAWFFRNFYWLPLMSMLVCILIIPKISNLKNRKIYILILSLIVISVGFLDNWTSDLLLQSYPI